MEASRSAIAQASGLQMMFSVSISGLRGEQLIYLKNTTRNIWTQEGTNISLPTTLHWGNISSWIAHDLQVQV
jgi:hypothetical protein